MNKTEKMHNITTLYPPDVVLVGVEEVVLTLVELVVLAMVEALLVVVLAATVVLELTELTLELETEVGGELELEGETEEEAAVVVVAGGIQLLTYSGELIQLLALKFAVIFLSNVPKLAEADCAIGMVITTRE